ncbi:hypothetical protein WDW89_16335 [Deltaproteobacteria bacterium TL4]
MNNKLRVSFSSSRCPKCKAELTFTELPNCTHTISSSCNKCDWYRLHRTEDAEGGLLVMKEDPKRYHI